MALPRITVVTPSYNQGRFVRETLESVLGQEYPALEYIVMDGGSTDESPSIIEGYSKRLAHWQSAKDRGQADAIKSGFSRATGEVLGWLNSDDTLAPGTLVAVGASFAAHPEVDLVYGDIALVDAAGGPLYTARPRLRWQTLAYENAFVPQQSMSHRNRRRATRR